MNAKPGRPSFAGDQAAKILELLREAGARGVSKELLIFQCGFTQCGARVFELEKRGFKILHEMRPGDRYVTFVFKSEPDEPDRDEKSDADFFEDRRGTGLPLFDLTRT
jgi:hypothetical protein